MLRYIKRRLVQAACQGAAGGTSGSFYYILALRCTALETLWCNAPKTP
jgi:hypothetical protein